MTTSIPPSVLFVAQNYHPEPIGSGPYMTDIAEYLAARGVRAEVLTCRPSYPERAVLEGYARGERDHETRNGVGIVRLKPWISRRRGALGRLVSEGTFLVRGLWALLRGRIPRRAVVLSLCPSIFATLLGSAALSRGGRHVALVHDIQSGLASGLNMVGAGGRIVRALQWLERTALNRCHLVLVLSDPMRVQLRQIGVRTPIAILPIWIDTKSVAPRPETQGNTITAMYSGNLGKKQGLDQILDMAALLRARGAPVDILIRGEGSEGEALKARAVAEGLNRVRFEPLVPADRLAESLSEGDIHLVCQHRLIADFAVPSKVFGIMAAGRPFVAAAPPGSLLWRLREDSDGFICVDSSDPQALADAVHALAGDARMRRRLGRNARAYVERVHDRERVLESFLGRLTSVEA